MFADDADYNHETHGVSDRASLAARINDGSENPHLNDNWDDVEGYYKIQIELSQIVKA